MLNTSNFVKDKNITNLALSLMHKNSSFIKISYNFRTINLYLLKSTNLFFYIIHFKLSKFWYNSTLVDSFNYEINKKYINLKENSKKNIFKKNFNFLIYFLNFQNILKNTNDYFLIYNKITNKINYNKFFNNNTFLNSYDDLFFNLIWLERENSEMSGILFFNKKDTRNLLLSYIDYFIPLKKNFPVTGVYELSYNIIVDKIVKNNINFIV